MSTAVTSEEQFETCLKGSYEVDSVSAVELADVSAIREGVHETFITAGATQGTFASVAALRDAITSRGGKARDPAYEQRMLHAVPDMPTVKDRAAYLVAKAAGKVVLDIGCTGPISAAIRKVAKLYRGIDRAPQDDAVAIVDLDSESHVMPRYEDVEVVICSEVLEHLANPGNFLQALRQLYPSQTFYFTVPNAGAYRVVDGRENVHAEHVAWYSYTTLKTLLARYKFEIRLARWYGGQPYTAEGLIVEAG